MTAPYSPKMEMINLNNRFTILEESELQRSSKIAVNIPGTVVPTYSRTACTSLAERLLYRSAVPGCLKSTLVVPSDPSECPYLTMLLHKLGSRQGGNLLLKDNLIQARIRSNDAIEKFITLFRLLGMRDRPVFELLQWRLFIFYILGCAEDYLKWKTCSIASFLTGQEMPERPEFVSPLEDASFIGGGAVYRYLRYVKLKAYQNGRYGPRSRAHAHHMEQLLIHFSSFLNLKRGMPVVSEQMVVTKTKGWLKSITTPSPPIHKVVRHYGRDWDQDQFLQEMHVMIRRVVREVLGRSKFDTAQYSVASEAAHYECPAHESGAYGKILRDVRKEEKQNPEFRFENAGEYHAYIIHRSLSEPNLCRPLGLAEPLKVRVITKSQPYRQTVLKYLQKFLLGRLREHPTFELCGAELSEGYLSRVLGNLDVGEVFNSGDYKNATDDMLSLLSNSCCEAISDHLMLGTEYRNLFKESLTGFIIDNPYFPDLDEFPEKDDPVRYEKCLRIIKSLEDEGLAWKYAPQARGQLMGSVTSFVVLCIVNAAVNWWVISRETKKLRDVPLAINGDDNVSRISESLLPTWELCCSMCGFTKSVGKSYTSKDWLVINSRAMMYIPPVIPEILQIDDRSSADQFRRCYKDAVKRKVCPSKYRVSLGWMPEGLQALSLAEFCKKYANVSRPHLLSECLEGRAADLNFVPKRFRYCPLLNLGLLYGIKRSGTVDGNHKHADDVQMLEGRLKRLVEGFNPDLQDRLVSEFVGHHRDVLNKYPGIPWFLPKWAGGYGLFTNRPLTEVTTIQQRIIAGILYEKYYCGYSNFRMLGRKIAGFSFRFRIGDTAYDIVDKYLKKHAIKSYEYLVRHPSSMIKRGDPYFDANGVLTAAYELGEALPELLFLSFHDGGNIDRVIEKSQFTGPMGQYATQEWNRGGGCVTLEKGEEQRRLHLERQFHRAYLRLLKYSTRISNDPKKVEYYEKTCADVINVQHYWSSVVCFPLRDTAMFEPFESDPSKTMFDLIHDAKTIESIEKMHDVIGRDVESQLGAYRSDWTVGSQFEKLHPSVVIEQSYLNRVTALHAHYEGLRVKLNRHSCHLSCTPLSLDMMGVMRRQHSAMNRSLRYNRADDVRPDFDQSLGLSLDGFDYQVDSSDESESDDSDSYSGDEDVRPAQ